MATQGKGDVVVGGGYGAGTARERVLVVNASHRPRMRRALWRHVARDTSLTATAAWLGLGLAAYILFLVRDEGGRWSGHVEFTVITVVPIALMAWGFLLTVTGSRLGRWVEREAVPGRLLAVTVGPESLRVRDHDTLVEVSYAVVEDVDQRGDVVVVQHASGLWALPVEVFDPVDLGVLRERARRPETRRRPLMG